MKKRNVKAFTVVELVIVIAVIAVLAAVMIPTFGALIEKANISADEAEITSLNTQLAIMDITSEADLYNAIVETYGEDVANKFAPRSAKYGYHYWYDTYTNTVILKTYSELDVSGSGGSVERNDHIGGIAFLSAVPLVDETPVPEFAHNTVYRMFYGRYFILDKGGSIIGDALKAIEEGSQDVADKLDALKADNISALAPAELKEMAAALLEKVQQYVYISNDTIFVANADDASNIVFTTGITTIPTKSASLNYIAKAENLGEIAFPSTVTRVDESSLWFDVANAVKLRTEFTKEQIIDVFKANSTNAIILDKDGNEYTVDGASLKDDQGTSVGSLEYSHPVTDFEILVNEDYANFVEADNAVYVPFEKEYVTLSVGGMNEDASSKEVTWSKVAVDGQDSSLISVDGNGKVSFVKTPENGIYTATVRATAVAGDEYRDIKICLVVVTDMTVTVNNNEVDLKMDSPYVELSYTGEGDSFNFVVDGFETNYNGYTCDTTVTYEYNNDIFEIADGKLTLKKDGQGNITAGERAVTIKVGPEDSPYLVETVNVEVVDNSSEPFVPAFEYVNDFTYRVGNGNAITLGTLFNCDKAPDSFTVKIKNKSGGNNDVYPELPAASGSTFGATYTADNANWENSTIKFSGVGIAVIEIDGVELLTLEVVNGTNYVEGATLPTSASTHLVLLGNVKITSKLSLSNKCLFGNGFEIDATGASNTAIGIITLNNGAMLGNAIVTGAIYTTYEGNSGNGQTWSTSLVFSSNGSIISNCYLSNTKAPVRVGSGTTTITNSTISGGCYANIDVRSGSELVLEDVTLINQVGGTTPSKNALGLGVVVHENAASASVIIKGNLTQYNAIGNNDKNYMAAQDIKDYFGYLGSADPYSVGGVNHVDAGIISLSGDVGDFVDCTEADESVRNTHVNKDVSGGRYLYHLSASAGPDAYNATYNYENSWAQNNYVPNAQGDIPPTYSTVLTTTKPAEGTKEYCYLDGSTIKIGFESGGSKTLTFSSGVFNITDSLGQKLDLKSITLNGTAISDTYTFSKAGSYTLKVSVVANGKTYTYTLSVNVVITSYKTASISLSSTTTTITGSSSKDYYVVFDILAGVTINDVDADGNARTVTINNTLPSGWSIALDDTGYIVTVTTNWLNASGEYTTLKITASNSGTGEPQNWTLTCDGNKGCPANALHSCYQKAKNKTVAPTATFVYYGFNGQASNSVKLTSSTTMGSPKHTVSDCVTPDTLVTLVDGTQKEIQYVTYEDMLLVWNHFTGEYEAVPSAIIFNHGYDYNTVIKLNFSDGTQVKIINSHQFLDADSKQYVNVTAESVAELVGHNFVKQERDSYTTVALESYEITKEYIEAYGIISAVHYNILVEGMFSTDFMKQDYDLFNYFTIGEGMVYDAEQMQEDIEKYGLYTYEDFAEHLTYEQFVGFNVQYFKIAVGKGNYTYEGILELIDAYLNNAELN